MLRGRFSGLGDRLHGGIDCFSAHSEILYRTLAVLRPVSLRRVSDNEGGLLFSNRRAVFFIVKIAKALAVEVLIKL